MGTRITSAGPKNQLEVYQHTVEQALDQYKQGKIDVTTAHQAHDEAVALLVEALYSHYLIRMRMLRAFRTPRDETFDERTGQQMVADRHGIFGKVAWYLERTDHLLTEVHAGRVTVGEASEQHSKLSTQVTVAMIDAFVDQLIELRTAGVAERREEPARFETYPVPRLLDLASEEIVRTRAHRSPTSGNASSPGPRAAGDLPGALPGDPVPSVDQAVTPEGEQVGRGRRSTGDDEPRMGGTRDPLRTYMWCGPCGLNHQPHCSFLLGGTENLSYEERQRGLRDRIRILTPRLNERERALFGLVWLQLDLLDELQRGEAHWCLDVLGSLVGAFEAVEAPTGTEPP